MPDAAVLDLIERSLEFSFFAGQVTPIVHPHGTGWRTLPYLVTAQSDGHGTLEVVGKGIIHGIPHQAICVPAGVRHRCTLIGPSAISRWSCTTYTVLDGIDLFSLIEAPLLLDGQAAQAIGEANAELAALAESTTPSLHGIIRRRQLGFAMLSAIVEVSIWKTQRNQLAQTSPYLTAVFMHIRQHLTRPIRLAELAALVDLSLPRFHAVFRQATGMPPHRYIQQLRIQKAQELLIGSNLPIGEVARRVGHADPFLFSRLFTRRCGMSPRAYRSRLRSGLM